MGVISERALSADPVDALRALAEGKVELEQFRHERVQSARRARASWDRIGEALGVSRQAAWEYYNRDLRDRLRRNVEANKDLTEAEAMELAASEMKTVRGRRPEPFRLRDESIEGSDGPPAQGVIDPAIVEK